MRLTDVEIGRYDWSALRCGCGKTAEHLADDLRLLGQLGRGERAVGALLLHGNHGAHRSGRLSVIGVDDGVALAPADHPLVHGRGDQEGDREPTQEG